MATKLKIGEIDAGIAASLDTFTSGLKGVTPASGGGTTNYLRADGTWAAPPGAGAGSVTNVSVVTANGVSGAVANPTTTPAITLTLGAITPSSVASVGTVTGSNLSGTNTGDQTITLTGNVTGSGTGSFATTIASNAVTNARLADVPTATFKGRVTAATGDPEDLTGTQATTLLNTFTSLLKGLAPASGGGTSNYLRADGTWAAPPGATSGTVTSVSVVTANGVSGSVATATTTPAITLTLGAITPTSVTAGVGAVGTPAYTFAGDTDTGFYNTTGTILAATNGVQQLSLSSSVALFAPVIRGPAGAVGAPTFSFSTDTNTGMMSGGADTLVFSTGGVERVRISSIGTVGIGNPAVTNVVLRLGTNITGAATSYSLYNGTQIQSDVTSAAYLFSTVPTTQAAAFTLTNLYHYHASQSTIGVGSSITNQFGFQVGASLVGASNNYGFYSALPAAAGRWNFYGQGTAQNYFLGNVGIGSGKTTPATALDVTGTITTSVSAVVGIQSSAGVVALQAGGGASTGYVEFKSAGAVRQGYIGASTTTAVADAGTIPYVAGAHDFTGGVTITNSVNAQGGAQVVNASAGASAASTLAVSNGTAFAFLETYGTAVPTFANQTWLYTGAANPLVFGTSSAERMRIDSTGIVSLSATTASTNPFNGALTVAGGLGVAGALNVDGGVGVNGYAYFGGGFEVASGVINLTSIANPSFVMTSTDLQSYSFGYNDASNVFIIYDQTAAATRMTIANTTGVTAFPSGVASTSTATGTVIVTGGVGVTGQVSAGILKSFTATASTTTTTGSILSAGGLGVVGQVSAGILKSFTATASTSATTGSVISAGGIGAAGNVYASGNLRVTGAASVIGYDTGSGGAVTQITSKATGVTLNKGAGAITMINSALAANTAVSFVVTNSVVAARDVVIVNIQSVGTVGAYITQVSAVAAGSFTITLRNMTAGSLSEAVVLNFAVIKAVNA